MKTYISYLLGLLLIMSFSFCGCEEQVQDWYGVKSMEVSVNLGDSLQSHFPDAMSIEWENRGNYVVASFRSDGFETEAWFTADAVWCMTKAAIPYKVLPELVKAHVDENTSRLTEAYRVERPYFCVQYYLEFVQAKMLCLESGQQILSDVEIPDAYPIELPQPILNTLSTVYPDFLIVFTEEEDDIWTIQILDADRFLQEVIINSKGEIIEEPTV